MDQWRSKFSESFSLAMDLFPYKIGILFNYPLFFFHQPGEEIRREKELRERKNSGLTRGKMTSWKNKKYKKKAEEKEEEKKQKKNKS